MELQSTALPTELRGVKLPRGFEPRVVDSKSTVFDQLHYRSLGYIINSQLFFKSVYELHTRERDGEKTSRCIGDNHRNDIEVHRVYQTKGTRQHIEIQECIIYRMRILGSIHVNDLGYKHDRYEYRTCQTDAIYDTLHYITLFSNV